MALPGNNTIREQIWALLAEGRRSDEEIANIVPTSLGNVRKEKSLRNKSINGNNSKKKKKAGPKNNMAITPSARTLQQQQQQHPILISPFTGSTVIGNGDGNRDTLSTPSLDSEALKTMYTGFKKGDTPYDIIAKYGFHPPGVEIEFLRFLSFTQQDPFLLRERIIKEVIKAEGNARLKQLYDKLVEKGILTNDDLIELLKAKLEENEKHVIGMLEFTLIDRYSELPFHSIKRASCSKCGGPMSVVVVPYPENRKISVICICENCHASKQ